MNNYTLEEAKKIIKESLKIHPGQTMSLFEIVTGCEGCFTPFPLVNPITNEKIEELYINTISENQEKKIPKEFYNFIANRIMFYKETNKVLTEIEETKKRQKEKNQSKFIFYCLKGLKMFNLKMFKWLKIFSIQPKKVKYLL